MQIIVIIFNVTLACCCLAVARWISAFRLSLRRSTQALVMAELIAHETLKDAPTQIQQGEFKVYQWTQFLSQMRPAIAQGKTILKWLQLSQLLGKVILVQAWKVRRYHSR